MGEASFRICTFDRPFTFSSTNRLQEVPWQPPPLDPAIDEELQAFVDRRTAEGGVPAD